MYKELGCFRLFSLPLLMAFIVLPACETDKEDEPFPDAGRLEQAFTTSNRRLIEAEEDAINDFVDRYGWEMQETGSGLRYRITSSGNGPGAAKNQTAVVDYTVYLITGDPVYSTEDEGEPLVFTIGRGGVVSGLEEGILLLDEGDQAVFIMPSHLAHGVPGDGRSIPRRATIIYEIELLELI
ncbi:MAG: FKBP-type peptidyl-prolyl cis-trans isomerase [Bacteroidales bacterium]